MKALGKTNVKVSVRLLCVVLLVLPVISTNASSFRFTITNDQRAGSDAVEGGLFFDRTLKAINNIGGPGAFHVSLGDCDYASTNPSTIEILTNNFGLDLPLYLGVGNHDAETPVDVAWLREEYNTGHGVRTPIKNHINRPGPAGSTETTYSWDYANAHFIMLNCYWDGTTGTNADSDNGLSRGDNSGEIKPELLAWLADDLSMNNKPFIFIFVHEPAFPYNHHYADSLDAHLATRDAFWQLLEQYKVSAVFSGHCHYYFKHRGDARGHTYNYPAHDSWRTQDPAIDSLYGTVWQICTGHSGWEPGGIKAGPTTADYLPASLQWNGLTFIDVNVTPDFAYINVYRDINNINTNPDTGLNFQLYETVAINGDFLAYNDCVFDPCLVAYGVDPCGNSVHYGDLAHITNFGAGVSSGDRQSSYVWPTSGELIDYTTGAGTGVICTMSSGGDPVWQPLVGSTWSGGYDAAPGTDAYNTFHGVADMTGTIYYGSTGWYVDIDFNGLRPDKTYTFATTASRAKDRTDGEPGYFDRITCYTISGIENAINSSTPGTDLNDGNPYSVKFNTGNNHFEGYVARWTGISPGADGHFKVRATAATDANSGRYAYAFNVFMLREEPMAPDNDPPTPNPMTWAIVPTATGSTSITMTATTATDNLYPPVQYLFECITDPNKSSNWQVSPTYTATGLLPNTLYTFRVKARDRAPVNNETGWSVTASAVTAPPGSMPTFVAAGTVASGTAAITPPLPAGIVTGDILLLFLETSNQTITISNANGGTWAAVPNSPQYTGTAAGSTGARLTVFWSKYNGTQGAPTTSDSGDHQLGRILAFRGVASSGNPWDVTAGNVEAVSDTTGSISGATTTIDNTLVVAAIASALPDADGTSNFSAWANSSLSTITERIDNTTSQGNGGGLGIATGGKVTAGAYNNTTVTLGTSAYKAMMSIALRPAGVPLLIAGLNAMLIIPLYDE